MKIESYGMSDSEVLRSLKMFVDENWDDGHFHLISVESIAEDGETIAEFAKMTNRMEIPNEILIDMTDFAAEFGKEWIVYMLYMEGEVCGLVAFSDWSY